MTGLLLALTIAASLASASDTLSDDALVAYASRPYDKADKMLHHDILGTHHGTDVVADFTCSDLCPQYTVRVIHYTVEPGPDCDRIGGVVQIRTVPFSIAVIRRPFCVPKVLVEKNLR